MEIAIEKCICFLSSGLVRMVSRYAYGDLVVEAAIHIDFVVWLTICGHFFVHSWSLLLGYHLWSLCCPLMVTVVQVTTCGHFVVHSWSLCCSGYHLQSLCCPLMVTLLFRLPLEVMKTKIRNNLQVLELAGMVSHKDHYQDLINAIVQVRPPHLSHLAFPMQLCCLCEVCFGCLFSVPVYLLGVVTTLIGQRYRVIPVFVSSGGFSVPVYLLCVVTTLIGQGYCVMPVFVSSFFCPS